MLALIALTVTVAAIALSVVLARRPAPVRVWIDVVRVVVAASTTAFVGVVLGVSLPVAVLAGAVALGVALGWWQGSTSTVWADNGRVLARRRIVGVAVWGAAIVAVKAAAFAGLVDLVALGSAGAWVGVGVQAAVPLGRHGRVRQALAQAATAGVVGVLLVVPLATLAPPAAADDHLDLTGEQLCALLAGTESFAAPETQATCRMDLGDHRFNWVRLYPDAQQAARVWSEWIGSDESLAASHPDEYFFEADAGLGHDSFSFGSVAPSSDREVNWDVKVLRGAFISISGGFGGMSQAEAHAQAAALDALLAEIDPSAPVTLTDGTPDVPSLAEPPVDAEPAEADESQPADDRADLDEPDEAGTDGRDEDPRTAAGDADEDAAPVVLISREDAETAAAAGAGGAAALGALSVLEASPGRRRRRLVTVRGATPTPGQVVEVDEADRHDLHATSGGQKATDEEQFGTHGRVVRPVLRVEDAEPGPGGERDGLSVVEVEEEAPGTAPPGGADGSPTPQPPAPATSPEPSEPAPAPVHEPAPADDLTDDQPRGDGPPAPRGTGEPSPDDDHGPDEDGPAPPQAPPGPVTQPVEDGGDGPAAEVQEPTDEDGDGGLRLTPQEIEGEVVRARMGGWETDELQRHLDGLNQSRGGSGTVPIPDLSAIELEGGRTIVASSDEIDAYKEARRRLEDWMRHDEELMTAYREAVAEKAKWVERQQRPGGRFIATMGQVLSETRALDAKIEATERAIRTIRYRGRNAYGVDGYSDSPGIVEHWRRDRLRRSWSTEGLPDRDDLERELLELNRLKTRRLDELLGRPGRTQRPPPDTSDLKSVEGGWEQLNEWLGNTIEREIELPGGTTADQTSMAHRPSLKIDELDARLDELRQQRTRTRQLMDAARELSESFERRADRPHGQ